MKRAVIIYKNINGDACFCNIEADSIIKNEKGSIEIWKGDNEMVGLFNIDVVLLAYISEKKESEK